MLSPELSTAGNIGNKVAVQVSRNEIALERDVGRFFFTVYSVTVIVNISRDNLVEDARVERWGDEVHKQGLVHLEVIKKMILKSGDDRRAVMGDMTY
jgi:hypothetical protein